LSSPDRQARALKETIRHALGKICGHRKWNGVPIPRTRPTLLGHIAGLVRRDAQLGREIRTGWAGRLTSDGPEENIVFTRTGDFYFVRCGGPLAVEEQDEVLTVALIAAD
jgi:hypothetical protein